MEHPILDDMPTPPPTLDQIARERIRAWIQGTGVKQTTLAPLIGKPQAWISRYLSGELGADLETLAAFARVFGHKLTALFDAPGDPGEARVIALYRALSFLGQPDAPGGPSSAARRGRPAATPAAPGRAAGPGSWPTGDGPTARATRRHD